MKKENFKMRPWHYDFCREYILHGENGKEAYKKVNPHVKDTSARSCASELLTHPEIRAEIEKIKQDIAKDNKMDLQRRLDVLAEIILTGAESNKIRAIELMNRMEGIGVDTPNQTININSNPMFKNFSDEDLKKIINSSDEDEVEVEVINNKEENNDD